MKIKHTWQEKGYYGTKRYNGGKKSPRHIITHYTQRISNVKFNDSKIKDPYILLTGKI